jgi:hypothetical protein
MTLHPTMLMGYNGLLIRIIIMLKNKGLRSAKTEKTGGL